MSWLGGHLNSITGKISEFTKDVLIDASDHASTEGQEIFPAAESTQSFQEVCKEKDVIINQLKAEKEAMQKSIVELDDQHQEALKQLLCLKSQVEKENKILKTQLKENELALKSLPDQHLHTTKNMKHLNYCDNILTDLENVDSLVSNLNILTVFSYFKSCHGEDVLMDVITQLEKVKNMIESKNSDDIEYEKLHSKINNYISYFKVIFDHSEDLLPFMKEIALAVSMLHSYVLSFPENGPMKGLEEIRQDDCRTKKSCSIKNFSNTCVQTDSFDIMRSPETSSCHSQTEIDLMSLSNYLQLLDSYSSEISDLQQQIHLLEEETQIRSPSVTQHSFSQQTDFYMQNSSQCQTDNKFTCNECSNAEVSSKVIEELQHQNDDQSKEIFNLRNELEKLRSSCQNLSKSSVLLQTDNLCRCADHEILIHQKCRDIEALQKQLSERNAVQSKLENRLFDIDSLEHDLHNQKLLVTEKDNMINSQKNEIAKLSNMVLTLQEKVQHLTKRNNVNIENGGGDCNVTEKAVLNSHCNEQTSRRTHDQLCTSACDSEKLETKLKAMNLEKSQLLSVLNEKSQECSQLKAEVHRLTNIVSSEKQALLKLQQDNQNLKHVQENNLDPDLTREALQNLSRLVRDRDVEIEALKQKNSSLSSVLQQSSQPNDEFQSLMEERETLTKQINKYKCDREKIMKAYNAKDQKYRGQEAEISKLKAEFAATTEKYELLEQQYGAISLQYEEKQKSLISTQNELLVAKQRISDVENQFTAITEKYEELLNKMQSEENVTVLRDDYMEKLNELETLTMCVKDKNDLIQEKDRLIHEMSNNVKSLKLSLEQMQKENIGLKKFKDDLTKELENNQNCVSKALEDNEMLQQKLSDKTSELSLLRDMNERLNMTVKENEFAIKAYEEKISSLSQAIHEKTTSLSSIDVDQILLESKEMYSKAQRFHRERDETLLSLSQKQQENQELKNEIQKLKANEDHLKNELDRLRKHMLQIEENYTNEALRAEEREKELRDQLSEIEKTAKMSDSAILDASHQASIQVVSLQEQVAMIAHQRDTALSQLSGLEDKVQQYSASLNNLQLVLEQMQKAHDQKQRDLEKKWTLELNKAKQQTADLQKMLDMKQTQLEESSQALEAASRLSEILDMKEEMISSLKEELSRMENSVKSAHQEVERIQSNTDGKVDRVVMKSLVLGYFSTPPTQKSEVVRLLARVLDFNQEEMQKAGIVVSRNSGNVEHRGIFSSIFGRLPSISIHSHQRSSSDSSEPSFTTLFVKFLENESQPVIPMPLPAEKMARELTSKAHANKHSSNSRTATGSPSKSSLLMNIDSAFPTFATLPAVNYSSPTILKEVLE